MFYILIIITVKEIVKAIIYFNRKASNIISFIIHISKSINIFFAVSEHFYLMKHQSFHESLPSISAPLNS